MAGINFEINGRLFQKLGESGVGDAFSRVPMGVHFCDLETGTEFWKQESTSGGETVYYHVNGKRLDKLDSVTQINTIIDDKKKKPS
ncbi:MAG: hypothetical protein HZA50_00565 [Planctomycetes bacterium]|nr:hypothetical protein [Planctomycetota bacterium]